MISVPLELLRSQVPSALVNITFQCVFIFIHWCVPLETVTLSVGETLPDVRGMKMND